MGNDLPDTGGTPAPGLGAIIAASLRRERERAGLSLSELAKRAGVAKSTLSQLESGTGNPAVETLWALGVALGVPFSRLVEPPRPTMQVIRAGTGPVVHAQESQYAATLLAACPPGSRHDIYRVVAQPGQPRISAPHMPGTIEHVVLATGHALAGPVGSEIGVDPGDYVTYPGDTTHIFQALSQDTSCVLILEHV